MVKSKQVKLKEYVVVVQWYSYSGRWPKQQAERIKLLFGYLNPHCYHVPYSLVLSQYYLVAASYKSEKKADDLVRKLKTLGFNSAYVGKASNWKVYEKVW